jgi:hypothetical protein
MVSRYVQSFHIASDGFTLRSIIPHRVEWFHVTFNHSTSRRMVSQQRAPRPHKLRHLKSWRITSKCVKWSIFMFDYFAFSWMTTDLAQWYIYMNDLALSWIISHLVKWFHVLLNDLHTACQIIVKQVQCVHMISMNQHSTRWIGTLPSESFQV